MMPYAPDKIIINSQGSRGMAKAIDQQYRALAFLGGEIQDKGWAAETAPFRDELLVECERHFDSDMKHLLFLREMTKKLAAFIDNHPPSP